MSFKYKCSDCGTEFYPSWWLGSENWEQECYECGSQSLLNEKLDHKQVRQEVLSTLPYLAKGG